MKEPEARKKTCPYLPVDRVTEQADGSDHSRVLRYANCIGSDCMMWRWHDAETHEVFSVPGKPDRLKHQVRYPLSGIDQSGSWMMKPIPDRRGYCGIAGDPFPGMVVAEPDSF